MRRAILPVVLALGLAACEDKSPVASSAVVNLNVTPTPVPVRLGCPQHVAGQPQPPNCFLSLDPTITVAETAGVGGRLEVLEIVVRDNASGAEQTRVTLDKAWIVGQAGTDRVEPFGSIAFRPVVANYPIPYGRPNLAIQMSIRFVDDRGNVLSPSIRIDVV